MKLKMLAALLLVAVFSAVTLNAGDDDEEKREKTRKMAAQTLQDLYKLEPHAKQAIHKAAGVPSSTTWGRTCSC